MNLEFQGSVPTGKFIPGFFHVGIAMGRANKTLGLILVKNVKGLVSPRPGKIAPGVTGWGSMNRRLHQR